MRNLLLFLAILLLSSAAQAQEAYTINATAAQVGVLDADRIYSNSALCASRGLISTCTQAQLNAAGGGGTIYAATLAGRQSFLIAQWIAENFRAAKASAAARNRTAYCTWWNDAARTNAEKNAECSKVGAATGCDLCE